MNANSRFASPSPPICKGKTSRLAFRNFSRHSGRDCSSDDGADDQMACSSRVVGEIPISHPPGVAGEEGRDHRSELPARGGLGRMPPARA